MKILRTEIISNEKDKIPPHYDNYFSRGGKHYHKIEVDVDYSQKIINVKKELWYITGHGSEGMDQIYSKGDFHIIFKTHEPEKLTIDLENKMIQQIITNITKHNQERDHNIKRLQSDINYHNEIKKEISKLDIFRENKLKRIVQ